MPRGPREHEKVVPHHNPASPHVVDVPAVHVASTVCGKACGPSRERMPARGPHGAVPRGCCTPRPSEPQFGRFVFPRKGKRTASLGRVPKWWEVGRAGSSW